VEASFGDETRLILYALESQAERGPCEPRSKWGMSAEDRAKHETWVNLGKMEPFEAMRLFVKLMDEERPGWWKDDHANPSKNQQDNNAAGDTSGARVVASPVRAVTRLNTHTSDTRDDDEEEQMTKNEPAWVSNLARGIWVTNPDPNLTTQTNASGPFGSVLNPAPRYRHASCVLGDEMFVVGGSDAQGRFCKGAELFHVLNLNTGAWRAVATKNLKPCAGARLVTFRGNAFLVGGDVESFGDANASDENANSSDDETDTLLDVSRIDFGTDVITGVETATFVLLRTKNSAGEKSSVPRKRRGHTACVVPGTESLVVFGGEDENRRFLNDARVLDMRLLVWRTAYEGDKESGFFGGFFFGLGARAKQDDDERRNVSQAPTPRAEHVAAAVWARNDAFPFEEKNASNSSSNENHLEENKRAARATLLVLGGAGASGKCFDDAYALDLETGRWTILRLDEYARDGDENENENENENGNGNGNGRGSGPGPRAGHASCVFLGRYLCLVGGGNDTSERREHALASVLDLRSMTWLASPRAFAAPPGAGEGMSLCVHETKTKTSTLLAFGGYDGACRDETHAFRVPLAFLDDDADAKDAKDGPNADVDRSARNAPRRSLFGRLLDPGPAPGSEDSRRENDPVRSGSAGSGNARTPEPPSPEPTSGEKVDALARDNLRLRRENARLREEIAEAHRLSESMRGRLEQSESRFEETSAALADARRAVAALETDLSASREGERKRLEATRRDLASQASQRNVSEAEGRAEAAGETRLERDESEEEEEPESRRGWLFGL
jgi:hypothetical protein